MKTPPTTSYQLPVMEQYLTLQGEGLYVGHPAYFVRLAGCDVGCHWCDVKASWNASLYPLLKTEEICKNARSSRVQRTVITGGEPLQYNLDPLTTGLREMGLRTHLETSGAYPLSGSWDWVCLSPKKQRPVHPSVISVASELKVVVYNKDDLRFAAAQASTVSQSCHLFLQPEWSRHQQLMPLIIDYLTKNEPWRLSLQTHKYINLP